MSVGIDPVGGRRKLGRGFYLRPAAECVTDFLGKVLVRQSPQGRLAGVICEVEAYPAFVDEVHHGNKRTPRSEVMWRAGGFAYVYVVYGMWNQFAAVVNGENIPDVVFVRGVVPVEGKAVMASQWSKPVEPAALATSPGKLCKSFMITKDLYGTALNGKELFLEDWGVTPSADKIRIGKRVGINPKLAGHDAPLRYRIKPADIGAGLVRRGITPRTAGGTAARRRPGRSRRFHSRRGGQLCAGLAVDVDVQAMGRARRRPVG